MADVRPGSSSAATEEPAGLPVAARPVRLDTLTGLRWWAALAVFVHHLGNLVPYPRALAMPLALGTHGVTFFFVLSGFVLTWSSGRAIPGFVAPDARTFWWRRVARIYPAHLVALLLALPVFTSLVMAEGSRSWVRPLDVGVVLLSVFLLHGWSRDASILFSGNPASWTLSCEAFFYALHPAADRALGRTSRRGALIVAASIVGVALVVRVLIMRGGAAGSAIGGLPWPVLRLTEFLLGMALARAVALGWRPRLRVGLVAAVVGVAGVWLVTGAEILSALGLGEGAAAALHVKLAGGLQEVMTVGTAALVVAVAVRELGGRSSVLARPWLVRLGEWSFAFYLVHSIVIYLTVTLLGTQRGPVGLLVGVLVFAASLLAAWALHAGVERPAERHMRSGWDRRRQARANA